MVGVLRIVAVAAAIVPAAAAGVVPPAWGAASIAQPSAVSGTVALMVIEPVGGAVRLNVIQRLALRPDDAGRSGPQRLTFPLPDVTPRARNSLAVEFVGGWRQPEVAHGVIIDIAPSGDDPAEVAYATVIRPRGGTAALRWTLPYGATDVEVLLPERGLRAALPGLRDRGVVIERGRHYHRWSAGPLSPGDTVSVRLDGRAPSDAPWPAVIAVLLAAALAGGLVRALRPGPVRSG